MSRTTSASSEPNPGPPPSFESGRRYRFGLAVTVGVFSAFVLTVLLNYLAARHLRWRQDLSLDDRYQLSPLTRQVLPLITNQVDVTILFDRESGLYGHVDGLLRQYALEQPRIHLAVVDPVTQREAAFNLRVRYKLGVDVENVVIFDDRAHPPIVVSDGELSVFDADIQKLMAGESKDIRRAGFKGEIHFTSALNALLEAAPARVAFLAGHNERRPDNGAATVGYKEFAELTATKNAVIETLKLEGTNDVPADLQLLIIAGGTGRYTEPELIKLERYLNAGGRLLWMLDPDAVKLTLGPEVSLQAWGIGIEPRYAGDPSTTRSSLDVLSSSFGIHPIVGPLQRKQDRVYLPSPRVVRRLAGDQMPADAPKVEVLVSTSTNGITKSDFSGGNIAFRSGVDIKGQEIPVAVAAEKGGVAGVTTGRRNGRVVVIGDVNMFGNEFLRGYANYRFAELTVAWLLDQAQLLAIGPKPIREYRLELTPSQIQVLRWTLLAGLPGGVLGLGVLVWSRRRS